MLHIRKSLMMRETLTSDVERPANRPIVRAIAMAVISNPFAGRYVDDLTELSKAGRTLSEQFASDLVDLLSEAPVSYGKGAIVGLNGEHEHGGACIHPMLGKPMRAAVGGGKAVIPSNVKVAACGTSLDVPLSHKDDSWSFNHLIRLQCRFRTRQNQTKSLWQWETAAVCIRDAVQVRNSR